MTGTMKSILSRVLSTEIGHQKGWKFDEESNANPHASDRDKYIDEIKWFMAENGITERDDYIMEGYYEIRQKLDIMR